MIFDNSLQYTTPFGARQEVGTECGRSTPVGVRTPGADGLAPNAYDRSARGLRAAVVYEELMEMLQRRGMQGRADVNRRKST